jgi:hypothetical protein
MDSKISALNAATVLTDADVLPIVNGAETKKVTVALLKAQVSVPTQTSQLTNNGANGVNPFITALDIPTAGQAGTLVREVKNMTGATLTKGTVVYISGANGNKPLVSKALATTDLLSSRTFGLLQSDILNNGLGFCVVIGDLTGFNTSSFTEGDQLYLSGATAGTITNVKPVAPIHLVYVGKVTRSHPTQGQIEVGIQNGYELEEIHDVLLVTPTNNQALIYESSTDLWKNKTVDKTFVGLGNVDNTSDANKPISTATQTALNLKQDSSNAVKIVIKDANASSAVTGLTTEQPIGTYLIPANTFGANDVMRISSFFAEKTGTVGTVTMRVKVGTTATFGSATTISTYTTGVTEVFCVMNRFSITLRGGLLRLLNFATSRQTDANATSLAISTIAFNPAVDNYIFTSLQLSLGTESVFQSNFLVTN